VVLIGGPVGAAMAVGVPASDVADAAHETDQYFVKKSAANTDIDPNRSIKNPDDVPGWRWLPLVEPRVVSRVAQPCGDPANGRLARAGMGEKDAGHFDHDIAERRVALGERGRVVPGVHLRRRYVSVRR
jgi:hypothetical protein